jgi:hypothetical protein
LIQTTPLFKKVEPNNYVLLQLLNTQPLKKVDPNNYVLFAAAKFKILIRMSSLREMI